MKSSFSGIKRILKAFVYSYDGFISVIKSEVAFRQDLLFCTIGGVGVLWLPLSTIQTVFLLFGLLLIILMELINTAIEVIVDRIGEEYHPLSKKAKDIGSLLVLLAFVHFFAALTIILAEVYNFF